MSADFTPDKENVSSIGAFRFWCQKVLPLVYDDSLSYYELLCRVVSILNTVIENTNKLSEGYTSLYAAFEALQGYVNDYFANLDLSSEVDRKIDQMAAAGFFDALVQEFAIPISQKGAVNGVATLNSEGKLVQMPTAADVDALPRDGSAAMTGALNINVDGQTGMLLLNTAERALSLCSKAHDVGEAYLIFNKDFLQYQTTQDGVNWAINNILHTGNKPSGSYTGNGSAASRTINVGGIGDVLAIYAPNCMAILTKQGGILAKTMEGIINHIHPDNGRYENGLLIIANDSDNLNYNTAVYDYQVL